jgi:phosphotransferase system HPr-like phosphotransfer protein
MIRYFLVLAATLLPLCSSGQAKASASASSTEQLESRLAAEICQDFDKLNATKPFDQLNKDEATSTIQQSMMQVMMKHPQEMEQLMKASGPDASVVMREIGQRVGSKLATSCPVAMVLFTRLSGSAVSVKAANLTISAEERPLLTILANEVCTDLSAQDAAKPLADQSKEARTAAMQQALQKSMKTHAREISERYGPEIFMDRERIFSLSAKVGSLMTVSCPKQLVTASQP